MSPTVETNGVSGCCTHCYRNSVVGFSKWVEHYPGQTTVPSLNQCLLMEGRATEGKVLWPFVVSNPERTTSEAWWEPRRFRSALCGHITALMTEHKGLGYAGTVV